MATQLQDTFIQQFSDANGLLVGGEVYFYEAGTTTTKLAIYQDAAETTELTNPQTLGDLGDLQNVIYMNGDYNIVIFDRFGTQKFQRDNFEVSDSASSVLDWMTSAQSAGAVIGKFTEVVTEGITINTGDIVLGDSAGSGLYESLSNANVVDPESESYDPNTGIGTDWISLSISSAEITQSDIDGLQTQIDDIEADFNTEGYFYGLAVTNSSGDSVNDLDFSTGTANDSTDVARITATSAFTKAIDAAWVQGTNQGGRPSGTSLASSAWWYCFIIGKSSDSSAFDFGFDTNADASLLLNGSNAGASGYDIYRMVDAWYWDATNNTLLQVAKNGFWSRLLSRETETSGSISVVRDYAAGTNGAEVVEVICPPNGIAETALFMRPNTNLTYNNYAQIYPIGGEPSEVDETNCDVVNYRVSGTSLTPAAGVTQTPVDSNSELGVFLDASGGLNVASDWSMSSRGYYFDPR